MTGNKMLKVGMRGHCGCGALSRSRRLSASSLPLEPRLSVQPRVRPMQLQEPLFDKITCEGLARVL